MTTCDYCGRENNDASQDCCGCGTRLPDSPLEQEGSAVPTSGLIDLNQIERAFDFREGFSRPDWKIISQVLATTVDPLSRREATDEAVMQWLAKLKGDLGGDYQLRKSRNFAFVSPLDGAMSQRLLDFSERAMASIRNSLGQVAWGKNDGLHPVIVFAEEDDYYQYISDFYPDGNYPKSSGVHVGSGCPHIALIFRSELGATQTIAHELAHYCVNHLPLPRWLNEGIAVVLQKTFGNQAPPSYQGAGSAYWGIVSGRKPPVVWDELADKHHQFWDEQRIQQFWAGTSFHEPGDASSLSYSLAEILIHLLAEKRAEFLAFIASARHEDAGQTAALDCLGLCLGNVAGTFLGEGNWRPQRKAIKECWEAKRANKAGDSGKA